MENCSTLGGSGPGTESCGSTTWPWVLVQILGKGGVGKRGLGNQRSLLIENSGKTRRSVYTGLGRESETSLSSLSGCWPEWAAGTQWVPDQLAVWAECKMLSHSYNLWPAEASSIHPVHFMAHGPKESLVLSSLCSKMMANSIPRRKTSVVTKTVGILMDFQALTGVPWWKQSCPKMVVAAANLLVPWYWISRPWSISKYRGSCVSRWQWRQLRCPMMEVAMFRDGAAVVNSVVTVGNGDRRWGARTMLWGGLHLAVGDFLISWVQSYRHFKRS